MASKEVVKQRTEEFANECFAMIHEKIDKAIYRNQGCIDIDSYPEDNALPKIIMHAVLRAMVDETKPLYDSYRKESDNLYLFI